MQIVRDLVNPSWLTLDRQRRCIYAAHGDGGEATAFRIDGESGRLTLLNRQATNGKNGVRLGVDAGNRFIVLANYSSGTVAVLPINADGSLAPLSDLATLTGKPGPHRTEQASAHPHDVVFDPRGRDFPFAGLTMAVLPLCTIALLNRRKLDADQVTEATFAGLLVTSALYISLNEGFHNWQALWTSAAYVVLGAALMTRRRSKTATRS